MSTPSRSAALFEYTQKTIPDGVNSLIRAFRLAGGTPCSIAKAADPYLWDADDTRYIDYVGLWGPMIVGHVHPDIMRVAQDMTTDSFSFGISTEAGIVMIEEICKFVPSIEQMRFVSLGTEATMNALRLAHGFTGRDLTVKFEGCYHSHADSLLVKAGSGLLTFAGTTQSAPSSADVSEDAVRHIMVLPYNDVIVLREAFVHHGKEIAAVIAKPVAGNMNLVHDNNGPHQATHALYTEHGAVLIFDEAITGFRMALGCT